MPLPFPTRVQTEAQLVDLIAGHCTPEQAAEWAQHWVIMYDPPINDWGVWNALKLLCGADLKTIDRPYLHGTEDFIAWLQELRVSSKER